MNRNEGISDLSNIFQFCKIVCDATEVTTDLLNRLMNYYIKLRIEMIIQ